MQSSHVLCHPLSYRNVPYGIIGLNVYIYIILCRFFATSMCILNFVIMRTCTGAPNIWVHVCIGVNRPAFGGTVPHFHQMSRVPRNETGVPHFLNGGYYFLRCRLFYIFALERNKVTNKTRFILRTPTDAVYISCVPCGSHHQ